MQSSWAWTRLLAVVAVGFLWTGCVAYDLPPQAAKPVPADTETWQRISTRSWQIPRYDLQQDALELLGDRDWMRIDRPRYESLLSPADTIFPSRPLEIPEGHQVYLVRGRGYGALGGKVRFQNATRDLSVYLVMYNGEFSLPGMRWSVADIPVVVALPRAPAKVHQSADIGGDSCFRLMDRD
ncbi:hypothetical protein [Luteolibacter marinus]|uniref:hypothetical protein n=1 Tax=Luteolibacter marinus TaxID=2776705 RepID=UPI0018687912|nr:hypothetical protein [Luteolibacter marinus]